MLICNIVYLSPLVAYAGVLVLHRMCLLVVRSIGSVVLLFLRLLVVVLIGTRTLFLVLRRVAW